MYIVTVIPIQKSYNQETLTYFSSIDIPLGSIVTCPIRLKTMDAIVIETEEAKNLKSHLKSADFQLKKIIEIKGNSPFTKEFFTACVRMKTYTVSNTGTIIKSMLPYVYLENIKLLEKPIEINDKENTKKDIIQEKLIFQNTLEDRISFYRMLIREAFARKQSVFICIPTHSDALMFKEQLSKGIEQYVYVFDSDLTKKKTIDQYNKVIKEEHPILIIGTGKFLSIPRHDIETIIVEHESTPHYKQYARPYIDIRTFAEVLSSVRKTKLIFGDTILRPETLYRHEQNELGEVTSPLFRLPKIERQIIVDMTEEKDLNGKKVFNVLSDTTKRMITHAQEHKESVFLYTTRKGLAPLTVCNDCGHALTCPFCEAPIVLYSSQKKQEQKGEISRIFMCNKCGRKEKTETRCPSCSSWNLVPLGIGTDRVYEEIKKLFPNAQILQIDKENSTDKEAKMAIEKFKKVPGCILIGNDMVFSYLDTQATHSAIISFDGLLSIPSFNITQKVLHTIEKLQKNTIRNVLIQTRIVDNYILQCIFSGNILELFRSDLEERKQFNYPPFKRLIKITFTGTKEDTQKAREYINKVLKDYDPQIFSAFRSKNQGQFITNTVIKVDINDWPLPIQDTKKVKENLTEILGRLPPSFSIHVDPEDLL